LPITRSVARTTSLSRTPRIKEVKLVYTLYSKNTGKSTLPTLTLPARSVTTIQSSYKLLLPLIAIAN